MRRLLVLILIGILLTSGIAEAGNAYKMRYNVHTRKPDWVIDTSTKLYFDDDTYFIFDGTTLKLYVNGALRQDWTTAIPSLMLTSDGAGNRILLSDGTSRILLP